MSSCRDLADGSGYRTLIDADRHIAGGAPATWALPSVGEGSSRRGRESAPIHGEHELFAFLTTEVNAIVAPIRPAGAIELQTPLPDNSLRIVARGERSDGGGT